MAILPKFIRDMKYKNQQKHLPLRSLIKKGSIKIKLNLLKIKSIFTLHLIIIILSNATMSLIRTILFMLLWNGVTVAILLNIFMILKINKYLNGEPLKWWNKSFKVVNILFNKAYFIGISNQQIFCDLEIHWKLLILVLLWRVKRR